MPIYVIGGQKGGTGKSTLATNLAVAFARAGQQPLLVDTDRQLTAVEWGAVRQSGAITPIITTQPQIGKVHQYLRTMSEKFDVVIVDAGGHDSVELRTALAVADRLYSPVKATQSDLWTLGTMTDLVEKAREVNPDLGAHLVLSMAPTNPNVRSSADALALLAEYSSFTVCRTVIHQRKAYEDAIREGKGVAELADPKAAGEMQSLLLEVSGAIPEADAAE